ncbi:MULTISPECIES: CynX/NimT family MFS transporter [unclassified Pseudarthrobacter]|uniref:MFS transporter n=1 Tax=unclassified Pseudarthrobacter TaxID=2647000 RepID=UPI00137EA6DE|nr:MFS transporter [Pseudarthrobacter sp. C1]MEA3551744.1 MFS transporter [Pseudarthrobacter sp. C1]MUU70952.1 MFS transporter [Pseudarthrobacter sp. GA104]
MNGRILARIPNSWILLACIGLLALNLRGPFVAVAPVVDLMQAELNFSPVVLGLLTSIPVLCFSLAAPLASLAARKFGAEFAVTLTILGVLAGVLVRSAGGPVLVVAGTVLIGLAITVGNIAVPLIIRRDFGRGRQGTAMGIYTAALNIGSFLTSVATAPLASLAGWRFALGSVAVLAVVAVVFWTLAVGVRRAFFIAPDDGKGTRLPPVDGARWTTAGLTAGFAGQAFSYYGVTAWLPKILADELGMAPAAAGAGSSLFQILAIAGSLGVPLAARFARTTTVAVALGLMWLTVPLGLLLAPEWWWLWCSLGGVAQGGGITLIFIAIIKIARDQASAGKMSAVVQGAGYAIGAAAPPLLGYLHGLTGSWTVPMLLILASVLTFFLTTTLSVRKVPKNR